MKTAIVNRLFTKLPDGKWQINTKDPMFEEHRDRVREDPKGLGVVLRLSELKAVRY